MHHVLAIACLLLIGGPATPGSWAQVPAAKPTAAVEELLWWLPTDTETVRVTQIRTGARGPLFEALEMADGKVEFGDVAYASVVNRYLKAARLIANVDGSRRFVAPSGLGEMPSEGAMILFFEKPLGASGNGMMAELEKTAETVEQIAGLKVVLFRDKLEDDILSSYITIPRADILVIATNRGYLEEMLGRRQARAGARALPPDLPEWRWVDASAPFWALRHYRRDNPGKDPTSPFRTDRSGNAFDADAIGVAAHASADGTTMTVHYLSKSPQAERLARRVFNHPGDDVSPTFKRASGDAIEVRLVVKDEEHFAMFYFYLLAALGHAIYL
jgi:hypothetical protein